MQRIEGWESISEAGEIKKLPAGAYVCEVIEAKDYPEKKYLEIYFDIVEGEFKDYFKLLQTNTGKNYGVIRRSYKDTAVPFFKMAIGAFEKSNEGYKWDFDETKLVGKKCAVAFRDEEYLSNGVLKVSAIPDEIRSIPALREGIIQIKPLKKYEGEIPAQPSVAPVPLNDDDLPF